MEKENVMLVAEDKQEDLDNEVPPYYRVTPGYDKLRIGHINKQYVVVNVTKYDYYILAGIEENEVFSKLVLTNMEVANCCAVDYNINKISLHFPERMRVLKKQVSHLTDSTHENLGYFTEKYENMFLKMTIHGGEYLWVLATPLERLNKFKQMIITFHDININQ